MGIAFLEPWVWLLAGATAVPIAIHLLSRDRSRRIRFPSVRFLKPTRLSAVTRRSIQDWPLLLLRIVLVLVAVAAWAGPVFVTPARQAAWTARVARAVVLDDRAAPPDDELRSARPGETFARERVRDAVHDALRWLDEQSATTREIVVLGAFKRGSVDAADFVDVPDGVGVRLVRTSDGGSRREREIIRLQLRGDRVVRVTEHLTLGTGATVVHEVAAAPVDVVPIRVDAPAGQRDEAEAALRAVLRRGLRLPPAGLMEPIALDWPGDVERLASDIETRLAAPLDGWEPDVMTDTELGALARPTRPVGAARPDDHGDRRALWAFVLLLLAVETWVRRGRAWA
ncbi:MAG: BatA domain-containing protein [Acidobacteria bacterium]|nr:BatA domain-containing protein [Acidobacteriota bacterium]